MRKHRTILIAGPTASGKSALALALAQQLGGTVINADSMQVYRELAILTARPTPEDERLAPHALYGHVPASEPYSAGRYVAEAEAAIGNACAAGRAAIVVGGTGLYFKALLEGLSPVPPIPEAVRARWRGEAARLGSPALHGVLRDRDPGMAERLAPGDRQRVVRALEVLDATGTSLAEWQARAASPVLCREETVCLVLAPPRTELARRAEERLAAMIRLGALEEVRALLAPGLANDLPAMRALGVPALSAHLRGEKTLEEAIALTALETRQYIKRQLTWLRGQMRDWHWLDATTLARAKEGDLAFIEG